MRNWRIAQCFAHMIGICAQASPNNIQCGKSCSNRRGENKCNDLGRRTRIRAEDVVNLGLSCISQGRLRFSECSIGITGDVKVENFTLIWRGSSKRSNDNRCGYWFRRSEELVGQVFVRLRRLAIAIYNCDGLRTRSTFPLPLSLISNMKDSSKPVPDSVKVRNA